MLEKIHKFFNVVSMKKYEELERKYNTLRMEYDRVKTEYARLQEKPDKQAYKIEQLEKRVAEVGRTNSLLMRGLGIEEFARVLQEEEEKENRRKKNKNK